MGLAGISGGKGKQMKKQLKGLSRHFTVEGTDPFSSVVWEHRDAKIANYRTGAIAFEQPGVEVPSTWSMNATNILAQKYFRGTPGTQEREGSLKAVANRIVDTLASWGRKDGYFADDDEAATFADELKYLLVNQRAAFNSPVWFNIGVPGVPQQGSACFILSVEDTMDGILNWYREEGVIFKGGSGAGVNLSRIRSSLEHLNGGGTASGPVSFMRGADASAGTIKSGGKTRRAAKMVILDVSHPDVEEFIWTKAIEERKARALEAAGFDMGVDGKDAFSIQYQNANNSVRVSDEFMQAVLEGRDWELRAVTTGEVLRRLPARELMREIAQAAWECADPGMQYDSTINRWHTTPNAGRINGSNPCFPGSAKVHTDKGLVSFAELMRRAGEGESFGVYTHDATNPDQPAERVEISSPEAFMITGYNPIVRLRFDNGAELRCTPGHRIFTVNRGYVEAIELTSDDRVKLLDLEAPAVNADWALPLSAEVGEDRGISVRMPEVWTDELAHYLGWLVGGGTTGASAMTSYDSAEDRTEILPWHEELARQLNGGKSVKVVEQADGAAQLWLSSRATRQFLRSLGIHSVEGRDASVPWSIEQAPAPISAAFLRGLFDVAGSVVVGEDGASCVRLDSSSAQLLRSVQALLSTYGVAGLIHTTQTAPAEPATSLALYIAQDSVGQFARHIGFSLGRKQALLGELVSSDSQFHDVSGSTCLVERTEEERELTFNLSEPKNHSYIVDGVVVRNCSEYMHLDNSSCNLASINLLKYLNDDGSFDVDGYTHAVSLLIIAQDILVGNADYPTEKIAKTSRAYRQLGIGYANLGALLMALGLPYDSEAGRAYGAALTSIMTGYAYETSARLAARVGAFDGYDADREGTLRVIGMHHEHVAKIDSYFVPSELMRACQEIWQETESLAREQGVRNAQVSLLAPTGTIGLLMDCDTTGIEPDLGLVKFKTLVGGGTMTFVNQTVPRALRSLGYEPGAIQSIVDYIDEHKTIVGAPALREEHLPVFACAMGDNVISYRGHIAMMAAVQPFLSGAISKTVNLPESATVEDIEEAYIESWRLGLKAVAIYRDNCKVGQPLQTMPKEAKPATLAEMDELRRELEAMGARSKRERLPRHRQSRTYAFQVADAEGYATVGEYPDGRPGEVFIKVSKQGSTLAGVMDAFSIAVSLGLQHGVPMETFVRKYVNMRFEPAGITDDQDIRIASSLVDYIFRRLALDYLDTETRDELGIHSSAERTRSLLFPADEHEVGPAIKEIDESYGASTTPLPPLETVTPFAQSDAPYCYSCGNVMQRSGSCFVCSSCGTTSGCS